MTGARPGTTRKVTPKSEAARKEELDKGEVRIKINGVVYTVNQNDITGLTERDFRKKTGMSLRAFFVQLYDDPGMDTFAAYIVLAKLHAGEETDFDTELATVSMGMEIDDEKTEADASPEA